MKFLPTKVHGFLDYAVGIVLILLPNIFSYSGVGGAAVIIPRVLGIALIVYSLFTRYEWGLFKVVPMTYHLVIDFLASVFLIIAPFIFGFHDLSKVWLPDVIIGAVVIVVVLVSQTTPGAKMVDKPKRV